MSFFGLGRPAQPSQREQDLEGENKELKREVSRLLVTTSDVRWAVESESLTRCGYACILEMQEANTALGQKVNSLVGKFEAPIGIPMACSRTRVYSLYMWEHPRVAVT